MRLQVDGKRVLGDGFYLDVGHRVTDARLIRGRVIVICDYMDFDTEGPARNLFCYDLDGAELWRASDLGLGSADGYTNFVSEEPLVVGNFAGFNCRVELETGRVLETAFTK